MIQCFIYLNFSCRKMPDNLKVHTVLGPRPKPFIRTLRAQESTVLPSPGPRRRWLGTDWTMTSFLPYPDITTISDAEFSLVTVTPHTTDPTSPAGAPQPQLPWLHDPLPKNRCPAGYCGVGGWLEPLTAPSQEMLSGSLAGYANPFPTPQCAVCISDSPFERFWSLESGPSILYFNWVTRRHICLAFQIGLHRTPG